MGKPGDDQAITLDARRLAKASTWSAGEEYVVAFTFIISPFSALQLFLAQ